MNEAIKNNEDRFFFENIRGESKEIKEAIEIAKSIVEFARKKEASLIITGKPEFSLLNILKSNNFFRELSSLTSKEEIDILLVSSNENNKK
jgi:K+-sensing histidine kinase KdpD